MKNIILFIVVIILIGVAYFTLTKNANDTTSQLSEKITSEEVTVGATEDSSENRTEEETTKQERSTSISSNESMSDESIKEEPIAVDETKVIEHLVTYTSSGFLPKTLTIKTGATVIFKNNNNRSLWVASANHPTHRIYPETSPTDCLGSSFDTCASLSSGETWSFTFNSVGDCCRIPWAV